MSFARISTWSLVGSIVICGLIKAKFPEIALLRWIWPFPLLVVAMFAWLGVSAILIPIVMPPRITIFGDRIQFFHCDSSWAHDRGACARFELVVFSDSLRRLRYCFEGKRQAVGIAESVSLEQLRWLLPYPVKIIDCRHRYATFTKRQASEIISR
jgi:hypothetical protein